MVSPPARRSSGSSSADVRHCDPRYSIGAADGPALSTKQQEELPLRRMDFRDRGALVLAALFVPALVAGVVVAWGYVATDSHAPIPDPNASPIIAIAPDGKAVQIP